MIRKIVICTIIWFGFWYLSTLLFFKDVAAAAWWTGSFAYPVALAIAIAVDWLIRRQMPQLRSKMFFPIIAFALLLPGPLWAGFVFWFIRIFQ